MNGQADGVHPDRNLTLLPPREVLALMLLGVVALGAAAVLADPAGRVLTLPAALLLLALVVRDLTRGPVLQAGPDGLSVLTGWRRVHAPWAAVVAMTVQTHRRTPVLDLDLGETVVVLGRGRLGRPPSEVLQQLRVIQAQYG